MLLQANLDSGDEIGASLAVQIDGETVVDLWGGYLDAEKTRPWQEDTIVNAWSSTKLVGSLAVLILADRGVLDLDEKVCAYWPAFAANGKEDVRVRHVISHTSGVPAWEKPVTLDECYDVEKSSARLAAQAPWWKPGTASGYHSLTHGHLISEIIRHATGKSLRQFISEEMAPQLHADFQLGAQEDDYARTANIIPPVVDPQSLPKPPPGSVMEKAFGAPFVDPAVANTKPWRDAAIGAGNGHTNARALVRILSPIVLDGTVHGVKFLSQPTIDEIFRVQADGPDLIDGRSFRFGTGFGLPWPDTYFDWVPTDGRICGWGGWGGSMGIIDVGRRMTIGYAMNKMHGVAMGSKCTRAYIAEIYRVLGVEVHYSPAS